MSKDVNPDSMLSCIVEIRDFFDDLDDVMEGKLSEVSMPEARITSLLDSFLNLAASIAVTENVKGEHLIKNLRGALRHHHALERERRQKHKHT